MCTNFILSHPQTPIYHCANNVGLCPWLVTCNQTVDMGCNIAQIIPDIRHSFPFLLEILPGCKQGCYFQEAGVGFFATKSLCFDPF